MLECPLRSPKLYCFSDLQTYSLYAALIILIVFLLIKGKMGANTLLGPLRTLKSPHEVKKSCYSCKSSVSPYGGGFLQSQVWPEQFSCSSCHDEKMQCFSCYLVGPKKIKRSKGEEAHNHCMRSELCMSCINLGTVDKDEEIYALMGVGITWLEHAMGMKFRDPVPVRLVKKKELLSKSGKPCLGRTSCHKKTKGNSSTYFVKDLKILSGLPGPMVESVVIHELTHAWLWQMQNSVEFDFEDEEEELLCDIMSVLYMIWRIDTLDVARDVNQSNYASMLKFRIRTLMGQKNTLSECPEETEFGRKFVSWMNFLASKGAYWGDEFLGALSNETNPNRIAGYNKSRNFKSIEYNILSNVILKGQRMGSRTSGTVIVDKESEWTAQAVQP